MVYFIPYTRIGQYAVFTNAQIILSCSQTCAPTVLFSPGTSLIDVPVVFRVLKTSVGINAVASAISP